MFRASVILVEPSNEILLLNDCSEKESKGEESAVGKRLSPPRIATKRDGLKSMICRFSIENISKNEKRQKKLKFNNDFEE